MWINSYVIFFAAAHFVGTEYVCQVHLFDSNLILAELVFTANLRKLDILVKNPQKLDSTHSEFQIIKYDFYRAAVQFGLRQICRFFRLGL